MLGSSKDGIVDIAQARARDDEVLFQIRSLTRLKKLDFCQQATKAGLVHLTVLTSLTHLSLRLPNNSQVGLKLWDVIKYFQESSFNFAIFTL